MDKTNITKDLLVAINNGYSAKNKYAYCKINRFVLNILWILFQEGLIKDFKIRSELNKVEIKLKYIKSKPLLKDMKLISKPKLQKFYNFHNVKEFQTKFDYFFISTSTGIISSKNLLKDFSIGGKVLFGLKINS